MPARLFGNPYCAHLSLVSVLSNLLDCLGYALYVICQIYDLLPQTIALGLEGIGVLAFPAAFNSRECTLQVKVGGITSVLCNGSQVAGHIAGTLKIHTNLVLGLHFAPPFPYYTICTSDCS